MTGGAGEITVDHMLGHHIAGVAEGAVLTGYRGQEGMVMGRLVGEDIQAVTVGAEHLHGWRIGRVSLALGNGIVQKRVGGAVAGTALPPPLHNMFGEDILGIVAAACRIETTGFIDPGHVMVSLMLADIDVAGAAFLSRAGQPPAGGDDRLNVRVETVVADRAINASLDVVFIKDIAEMAFLALAGRQNRFVVIRLMARGRVAERAVVMDRVGKGDMTIKTVKLLYFRVMRIARAGVGRPVGNGMAGQAVGSGQLGRGLLQGALPEDQHRRDQK